MKKYFIILLSLLLLISALSSCESLINTDDAGTNSAENEAGAQSDKNTKIDSEQVTEAGGSKDSQSAESTDSTGNTGLGMGTSQGGGDDYTNRY